MSIGVGIIGAGIMGADHARIFASSVAGAHLVAISDADAARAKAVAEETGARRALSDPFALISDPDVGAVLIASPDATHPDFAIACIRAGKPVLCEKPLAPTAVEGLRVIEAEIAGGQFEAALEASRAGKSAEAEALLTDLVKGAGSGYRDLARFRVASEMGLTSPEKAVKAFDELAADAQLGPLLQGLARLRAAYLVADSASMDELKARVEPLLPAGGAWGSSARELLGLKALKANDFEGAGKYFDAIMTEDAAPQALKQRAELYLSLVRGGAVSAKP